MTPNGLRPVMRVGIAAALVLLAGCGIGKAREQRPAPRAVVRLAGPLTREKSLALAAFAEAFGRVRDFHPSSESLSTSDATWWDVAAEGARRIETGTDDAAAIRGVLQPFAPTMRVWRDCDAAGRPEVGDRAVPDGATHVVVARVEALAAPDNRVVRRPLRFRVGNAPEWAVRLARDPAVVDLAGGWHIEARTALYGKSPLLGLAGRVDTFPKASVAFDGPIQPNVAADRWSRIATAIVAWNDMRSFEPEPFAGVTDAARAEALLDGVAQAADARDERGVTSALRAIVARFNDGHGDVSFTGTLPAEIRAPRRGRVPIGVTWAGPTPVVTSVLADAGGSAFALGDVITAVNDKSIGDFLVDTGRIVSGTEGFRRLYAAHRLLRTPLGQTAKVGIERGGRPMSIEVAPLPLDTPGLARLDNPEPGRRGCVRTLGDGIVCVDLAADDATPAKVMERADAIASARAIVVDLRGQHQDGALDVLAQLSARPMVGIRILRPVYRGPGDAEYRDCGWSDIPGKGRFAGKPVAFLADARVISFGESLVEVIRENGLGKVFGTATAGANGNVFTYALPCGFSVSRTGLSVTMRNGDRINGVGIRPDVTVIPTVEGLRQGRDEVLDAAIAHLKGAFVH